LKKYCHTTTLSSLFIYLCFGLLIKNFILCVVLGFLSKVARAITPNITAKVGFSLSSSPFVADPLQAAIDKMKSNAKKNALVPPGVSTVVTLRPKGPETAADALLRQNTNFLVMSTLCVTSSTHLTYSTGMRAFLNWCAASNIDATLEVAPLAFAQQQLSFDHKIHTIGSFVCFLSVELKLQPGTVSNYVYGVRDYHRRLSKDLGFFNHVVLKQLKSAINVDWNAHHHKFDKKNLPFTIQMAVQGKLHVMDMSKPRDMAVMTAVEMGLVMLNRSGELVVTAADHYIRALDVFFELRKSNGGLINVLSSDAWEHQSCDVLSVTVTIRSAKNDADGQGHKLHFKKKQIGPEVAFCIASSMFSWAVSARPVASHPFLSHHGGASGKRWFLSYKAYVNGVKAMAAFAGFDPDRFGSHSIRIGGATVLAAAGHPNHYIMKLGRWKSLAFLGYIHWAINAMDAALGSLVDPRHFGNDDIRRLNPAALL